MIQSSDRLKLNLPRQPGTYALLYQLESGRQIKVGKLGTFDFPAGCTVYVGSALGSGGLAGRLNRHLNFKSKKGPKHWHIDYLAAAATLQEIWILSDPARREHTWAGVMERMPGAQIPVPRFGASDCRCASHLFAFQSKPDRAQFNRLLAELPEEPAAEGRLIRSLLS